MRSNHAFSPALLSDYSVHYSDIILTLFHCIWHQALGFGFAAAVRLALPMIRMDNDADSRKCSQLQHVN
jgi:hypothetical protein